MKDTIRTYFEALLEKTYKLSIENCRSGDEWWSFNLNGLDFQGGFRNSSFELMAHLCQVDTDPDEIDQIWEAISAANRNMLSRVAFTESDCHLYLKASCQQQELVNQPDLLDGILEGILNEAKSETALALTNKLEYTVYDW